MVRFVFAAALLVAAPLAVGWLAWRGAEALVVGVVCVLLIFAGIFAAGRELEENSRGVNRG